MRFCLKNPIPERIAIVTLVQDENEINLKVDNNLIGWFDSGTDTLVMHAPALKSCGLKIKLVD